VARQRRQLVAGFAAGLVATILALAVGEAGLRVTYLVRSSLVGAIPLPYVVGHAYGPSPPWADRVRLLEPDEILIWRMRPGIQRRYVDVFSPVHVEEDRVAIHRRFAPSLPESLRDNPTWKVTLNSRGFRAREFESPPPPSRLRIVCLGDSWTFGANVGQEDAYPQRLEVFARQAFPGADLEVLNLGVLGYTTYQGIELFRTVGLALQPDVVVIGYGMNDSSVAGFRDEDVKTDKGAAARWTQRLATVAEWSEIFRLLRYLALAVRYRPSSVADSMREADRRAAEATKSGSPADQYAKLEPWTRVPLPAYERNLTEMVALARSRGAHAVLIFNELWLDNPYRAAARSVARRLDVPFIDTPALIAGGRRHMEIDLERRLGLEAEPRPIDGNDVEVIFRAHANGYRVPTALYIVGAHSALGDLVPNRVAMHDDGTHGDQRAGDGVWSYAARMRPGARLSYVYTNSGREGRWEGLDVPALRDVNVEGPGGRTLYRPIDSFGKLPLQADSWHPDAEGYRMIASAVLEALKGDEQLRRRLERRETKPPIPAGR
jgi:lysophospholipase L1-like esterase